eukprot:gene11250-17248_t
MRRAHRAAAMCFLSVLVVVDSSLCIPSAVLFWLCMRRYGHLTSPDFVARRYAYWGKGQQ